LGFIWRISVYSRQDETNEGLSKRIATMVLVLLINGDVGTFGAILSNDISTFGAFATMVAKQR
jgi:hypothetical protein